MAAVLRDVVGWANKFVEVLEHVLGIKKYKNCFGKFDREARQISLEPRKMELLLLTAVAPASGIGHANKLAEVVDQVLGVKKTFYSFGKLGREPLQRSSQKSDTPKFATSRPHREPGNRPRAQTLLFLQKARPELLKMSGGSAYLGGLGRKLYWKNKNGQDFVAGLYIYIYWAKQRTP